MGSEGDAVAADLTGEKAERESTVREEPKREKKRRPQQQESNLVMRPGYMYRAANWEIGRAAERARVRVKEYKPRDRFAAWRKTVARKAKNAERRSMGGKRKK